MIDCNESPGEVSVNNYLKMPYKYPYTIDATEYNEEDLAAFARHMLRRCENDESVHGKGRDFILADVNEEGTEGGAGTITDPGLKVKGGDSIEMDDWETEFGKLLEDNDGDLDGEEVLKTLWRDMMNKAIEDKLETLNFDDARMRYGHLPWVQVYRSVD